MAAAVRYNSAQDPNRSFNNRELIMPPGVMSLGSNFGWLANHERGQRSKLLPSYYVKIKSARLYGQFSLDKMLTLQAGSTVIVMSLQVLNCWENSRGAIALTYMVW